MTALHTHIQMHGTNAQNSKMYKHQLSLTNPYDALHHGKRAANKGGRSVLSAIKLQPN